MKTIVITGSTKGIGKGMAEAFLDRGCKVVISSRSAQSVEQTVAELGARFGAERVFGQACDVGDFAQVQALWDGAVDHFGSVDIWVNNAAATNTPVPLWQQEVSDIDAVVSTNLTGLMYSCKVAITGMLVQGRGHVYNMEGIGSDGRVAPGVSTYGATKRALRYLTQALAKDLEGLPVGASTISPGMVPTEMLAKSVPDERKASARRIFNILADRVETVAPWLVDKMLANEKSGASIAWMTTPKIAWRFATAPFIKRDVLGEEF